MRTLMYSLFFSIFFLDYLQGIGLLPRAMTYLPELLSIIATITVLYLISARRNIHLTMAYFTIFLLLGLLILFGIIANQVGAETLFVGIRKYLKFLPFFFLPLVYSFSEKEIRGQITILVCFAVVQLPVALHQKFIGSIGRHSGDLIGGTLGSAVRGSGLLTIFLICAITILTAYKVRNRITSWRYFLLLTIFVLPTMINETKITFFLLPLALILPTIFAGSGSKRLNNIFTGILLTGLALGSFISVYDSLYSQGNHSITEFITKEGRLEGYLKRSEEKINQGQGGRIDAILIPLDVLSKKPESLLLGLGLGNVSRSSLGDSFSGAYYKLYGHTARNAISNLIWEFGLIGVLLIIIFNFLLFRDALRLATLNGIKGDIALGWACVVCIITISMFYTNVIGSNAISYLFFYFSGFLVAISSKHRLTSYN